MEGSERWRREGEMEGVRKGGVNERWRSVGKGGRRE